jgi:CDP-diacylglycerol--glycerol-3-phosphate 3-phosphatidyltransferase
LALIPIFVVLVLGSDEGHSWPAALVFAAAGITDQVDGWLARRWQVESEFGRYFDPLADRLIIDAAVVLLWLEGRLPWIALAVILVRDGLLVLATPAAIRRGYEFSVNFLGKAATWGLYASLAFVLATRGGADWPLWLFWASLGLAIAAGAVYAAAVWKAVRR